ncbi:MAG: F-type H+-transporting ATPase subunit a [Actinomycetota bacterium]|jgi:F-type H+-transporting ATPase subunit a|nr:F-type H+-transporting ATPase subunit a [Actinomycetota bacterium]
MNELLALDFPPISHLTIWPEGPLGINKTVGIYFLAVLLTLLLFFLAGAKKRMVPTGVQAIAESSVDFVRNQIIMPTMGVDGMPYLPLLATMFFFILFSNLTEIIPFIQFPANARIAMPMILALLVWVIFNVVGVIKQGPIQYLKGMLFPPGLPKAIYVLYTPIEFVSVFFIRPLSLSVRLFANMLAGHLILVTFAVLCAALWTAKINAVILPFPFLLLIAMTGFEVLVAFLQAFIFAILTAVYIGSSMHPEH